MGVRLPDSLLVYQVAHRGVDKIKRDRSDLSPHPFKYIIIALAQVASFFCCTTVPPLRLSRVFPGVEC